MTCHQCTQLRAQLRELETQRAADAGCKRLLEGEILEQRSEVLTLRLEGVRLREESLLLKAQIARMTVPATEPGEQLELSRTRRLEVD